MAEKYYKLSINLIPNRLYPNYLLAKFYLDTEQIEKAKMIADNVLEMEAKVNSSASEDIFKEMKNIKLNY